MKKFKALLKSRRGVAIEFAIGVMFITVAVSTILLSTAIHEINAQQRDNDSFSEKLAVEQFAEEALYDVRHGDQEQKFDHLGFEDTEYSENIGNLSLSAIVESDDNGSKIIITNSGVTVLEIKLNPEYQITSWTWK